MLFKRRLKYRTYTDEDLLILYKQDQDSMILGEYYNRYSHLVMGTAMKYLKNVHDAEDITMLVFEKLPKKLISHNISFFKSWLYMVVKNECLMLLRKKSIPTTEINEELDGDESDELVELELKEEQLNLLEQEIGNLKSDQKKCIELFYLEQKSYQEITDLLGMELKKVKSAIQNGKRNLKIKLEGNHEFESIK